MSNVYVPQDGGQFPVYPPSFYGNWNNTIGMGKKTGKGKKKKKTQGKGVVIIMSFLTQNPCTPPYKTPVISLSFLSHTIPLSSLCHFLCLTKSTKKMSETITLRF